MFNENAKEYDRDECPLCGSEDISQSRCGDDWISWECHSCPARWTEHLDFTHVNVWKEFPDGKSSEVLMTFKPSGNPTLYAPTLEAIGGDIIKLLGLRVKDNGRVDTSGGDKTALGLARTVIRAIEERAGYQPSPDKKTITVVIEGGVIQSIDDIPKGVEIVVKDFDADGVDRDRLIESKESPGDFYFQSTWEHFTQHHGEPENLNSPPINKE